MKVSVAIATHNGDKYLLEQLQSIVNQTYKVDEIIISDDNSQDKTLQIAQEFLKDQAISYDIKSNKNRLGPYKNFERAIKFCSGDLIFLSDHDDIWFPNKIEEHVYLHRKNISTLVFTNDCFISDQNLNTFGASKMNNLLSAGYDLRSMVMGCCCSFKKKILQYALPFPDEFKGHDNWLCSLADKMESREFISKKLQLYRQHGRNTSTYFANNPKGISLLYRFKRFFRIFDIKTKDSQKVNSDKILESRIKRDECR